MVRRLSELSLLTFKRTQLLMQMHEKNTPEIHFVYLGNKEIYCIFMACCIISVLFSIKYCLFYNFVLLFSNNTFFRNHALKFKYQPVQIVVKYAGIHVPTCTHAVYCGHTRKTHKVQMCTWWVFSVGKLASLG
jgi:hypothetical protein